MLCMLDHAVIPHSHTPPTPFERTIVDIDEQILQFLNVLFYHKRARMSRGVERYFGILEIF